jgi:hypothetical protein
LNPKGLNRFLYLEERGTEINLQGMKGEEAVRAGNKMREIAPKKEQYVSCNKETSFRE